MRQQFLNAYINSTEEAREIIDTAEDLALLYDLEYHPGLEPGLDGVITTVYVYQGTTTRIYENIAADEEVQDALGLAGAMSEAIGYWNE